MVCLNVCKENNLSSLKIFKSNCLTFSMLKTVEFDEKNFYKFKQKVDISMIKIILDSRSITKSNDYDLTLFQLIVSIILNLVTVKKEDL